MEWVKVYYNGLETNIEVTRFGKVRKVRTYWEKNKTKIGEVDFSKLKLNKGLYQSISIKIKKLNNKNVQVQQLIAAAFLGYEWNGHKFVVDHIDSNKTNNHINNLRIITNRENCSKEKTIKSGLPVGVSFHKKDKKYESRIQINKKNLYLGSFKTYQEASKAYKNKLKELCV